MKKIIFSILIITTSSFSGIFGDTEEEREIAKERLQKMIMHGENKELLEIRKENMNIKKALTKNKINFECVLKNKIKVKNQFIITEKEEMKILEEEQKELKRLLEVNYIVHESKEEKKELKKPKLNMTITENKNIEEEIKK